MKRLFTYCILVLVLWAACGCTRGRVLSVKKFSKITEEMLLADAWLEVHPECRTKADTSLLYDPIFKKYGCRFRDYDSTLSYMMEHPEKYVEALQLAHDRVEARLVELDSLCARNEALRVLEEQARQALEDSLARADSIALADSLARVDSLALADSLAVADSLALADSLAVVDSLARGDSMVKVGLPMKVDSLVEAPSRHRTVSSKEKVVKKAEINKDKILKLE